MGWFIVTAFLAQLILDWELYPRHQIVPGAPWIQLTLLLLLGTLVAVSVRWPRSPNRYVLLILWAVIGLYAGARLLLPGVQEILAGARAWVAVFLPSTIILYMSAVDDAPYSTIPRVAVALVIVGAVLSAAGMMIFLTGSIVPVDTGWFQTVTIGPLRVGQILTGIPPVYRISAFTGNANTLAFTLFVTITLTLTLAKADHLTPLNTAFALALQGGALLLTYSRSGLLLTLFGVSLVGSLSEDARLSWRQFFVRTCVLGGVLIGGAALILGYWLGPDAVIRYVETMGARLELGFATRIEAWEGAVSAFLDQPLVGIGLGNISTFLRMQGADLDHAHNVALNVAAELGIVGLSGLTAIVVIVLRTIGKGLRDVKYGRRRVWYIAVSVIVLGYLVRDIAESTLLRVDTLTFIWVYMVGWLSVARRPVPRRNTGEDQGFDGHHRAKLEGGG